MIKTLLLWGSLVLSTILSAGFFFSLGDTATTGSFLAAVGIIFEGLKAYSWRRTGAKELKFLWLAVPCTILSLTASLGYASLTLEKGWSTADSLSEWDSQRSKQTAMLDEEEKALLHAIERLPSGWTASALRLGTRLDEIRATRQSWRKDPRPSEKGTPIASLAVSLGNRIGIDGAWVVTALLLGVATVLEVGIIVLMLDKEGPGRMRPTDGNELPVQRFLRQAVGPDGRLLGRRRLVELGWSEREVRTHVATLVQSGVLTHEGRGSPIRLATQEIEVT